VILRREQLQSNQRETDPQGRKARLITDIDSTDIGKEEMSVHL
jgi:hypothetical protein